MSKSKKVVNTIMLIVILIFTSKIIGFVRDSIIAFRYGHADIVEAYTSALALTINIFLSGGNALLVSMIPILIRLKKDKQKHQLFMGNTLLILGILSLIITTVGWFTAPQIVSVFVKGFVGDPIKYQMTVTFVRYLNISSFFIFGTYFLTAFRQSNEKYMLTSLVSYPYNIIFIVFLLFGFEYMGLKGLVVLTIIGWALQMAILTPGLKKMSFKLRFSRKLFTKEVLEIFVTFVPILFVTASSKVNILLDNLYASMSGSGGVAAIYYANILFIAISTTAVFAVTSVMFPKFNITLNEGSREKFETTIVNTLMSMVFALTLLGTFLFAFSTNAVHIIFERGQFDAEAARNTSEMLKWYALGMMPLGLMDVTNKSFYTIRNYKIPVISGMIIVGSNLTLMALFAKYNPPYFIAISTTLSIIIGLVFSLIYLNKQVHINIVRPMIKVTLQSIVALFTTIIVLSALNHNLADSQLGIYLIQTIGIGLVGLIVYLVTLIIVREPHVYFIIQHYIFKKKEGINDGN